MQIHKPIGPVQVWQALNNKYGMNYYFFTSKYINQLIYSVGNSLSIQFQYQKAYDDDIQYLRRSYRQIGLNGKKQIEQRIKLVSKYYEDNGMVTAQNPLMVIPQIREIFIKRKKRLKKLRQHIQDSKQSKQSASFGSGSLSFSFQQDFLKQLKLHFSQLMEDSSVQLTQKPQFNDTHDIYGQFYEQENPQEQNIINFKNNSVQHLVCDFQEIDVDSILNFYKDIKKSKNGSTIMNEIMYQSTKSSKRNSQKQKQQNNSKLQINNKLNIQRPFAKNKKSSSISKQTVLTNYISVFAPHTKNKQLRQTYPKQNKYLSNNITDQYVDQYKKIWLNQVQNAQEQIEKRKIQLKSNRQKIRQKAQKLLLKINKQSITSQIR